jgi:cell division protein ZapA (FtsZ GTPase activity inhibitor)
VDFAGQQISKEWEEQMEAAAVEYEKQIVCLKERTPSSGDRAVVSMKSGVCHPI